MSSVPTVLSEEEYLASLHRIVKRDFFSSQPQPQPAADADSPAQHDAQGLGVDDFVSRYTSSDNAAFAELRARSRKRKRQQESAADAGGAGGQLVQAEQGGEDGREGAEEAAGRSDSLMLMLFPPARQPRPDSPSPPSQRLRISHAHTRSVRNPTQPSPAQPSTAQRRSGRAVPARPRLTTCCLLSCAWTAGCGQMTAAACAARCRQLLRLRLLLPSPSPAPHPPPLCCPVRG